MTARDAPWLSAELARELDRLALTLGEISERLGDDDDTTTYAIALLLMNYYTGVERLLTRVTELLGGPPSAGGSWHRQLLEAATLDIEGVRPAVLSDKAGEGLAELLRFRHAIRNMYAWTLGRSEVQRVATGVGDLHLIVARDVQEFRRFLKAFDSA